MLRDDYEVAACRLVGSEITQVAIPPGWSYEKSLSASFEFTFNEHVNKVLKYLRHENGIDVYLNLITGKGVYAGRTGES
jgi:hypothetical protein